MKHERTLQFVLKTSVFFSRLVKDGEKPGSSLLRTIPKTSEYDAAIYDTYRQSYGTFHNAFESNVRKNFKKRFTVNRIESICKNKAKNLLGIVTAANLCFNHLLV